MSKVIGIGETVTDIIIRNGKPEDMVCGGSCFNSMISLGRCGLPALFIGEVGADKLGFQTKAFLEENGIETSFLKVTEGKKSQLSLAFLNERNDAEYVFYKDHSGDVFPEELPEINESDIVLYGSFFALNPIVHPALSNFLAKANETGAIIYYDVNFRSSHLGEKDSLAAQLEDNFSKASIVRGSDEDFLNLYGTDCADDIYKRISPFCKILIITRGGRSLDIITPAQKLSFAVPQTKVVSTVGAGDSFNAGVVFALMSKGISKEKLNLLEEEDWKEIVCVATAFSSEVCGITDNYISKATGEAMKCPQ